MRRGGLLGLLLAGGVSTLLGIGLQRFAYGPLLPAMVLAGWLGQGAAGALGAANLGGYLAGALLAGRVARAAGLRPALRGAMLTASACFALCAWNGGLAWLLPWRTLAGAAGGVLMVLAGPAVQAAVPADRRGLAAGVTFAGVGAGIVVSALLVPALLPHGLAAAWLALAATGALLAALSWTLWPDAASPRPGFEAAPGARRAARRLIVAYGLAAVAATPHMLWWPDYVARGLGEGAGTARLCWMVFGLAAATGPALYGRYADRAGAVAGLRAGYAAQIVALLLPLAGRGEAVLLASSALAGSCAIGLTAVTLTRTEEIAGRAAPAIWRLCTATYGAAQTAAGFLFALLLRATGSHQPLFVAGTFAALLALPLLARTEASEPLAVPPAR